MSSRRRKNSDEELKEMSKVRDEEDEPLFMNEKNDHKITRRKDHRENPSIFSFLPASLKYIFLAIMALGVILIGYILVFTNNSSIALQNKRRLLDKLKNELIADYLKTAKDIESTQAAKLTSQEFFELIVSSDMPLFLDFEKEEDNSIEKVNLRLSEEILDYMYSRMEYLRYLPMNEKHLVQYKENEVVLNIDRMFLCNFNHEDTGSKVNVTLLPPFFTSEIEGSLLNPISLDLQLDNKTKNAHTTEIDKEECLFVPPYWWTQLSIISEDEKRKIKTEEYPIRFSYPAPEQL
ncbi:unnamed protein product [Moneuplotes crassus]|uniref:Uncharacterized protein n=1 Tax=Euplotes crassus TaxID=5936 RepID=A0AAD1XK68_EUPCR|nr:unnamed protein product [Moneuplotes crassus]